MRIRQKALSVDFSEKGRLSSEKTNRPNGIARSTRKLAVPSPKINQVVAQIKKTSNVEKILNKDKKKTQGVWEPDYLTRDVSYLREFPNSKGNFKLSCLPTDLQSLEKLYNTTDSRGPHLSRTSSVAFSHIHYAKDTCTDELPMNFDTGSIERYCLGTPTGRQQTENLSKWFHFMRKQHQNREFEADGFSTTVIIHQMCLREITRQVSVQCLERGNLLREVLDSLDSLYKSRYEYLNKNLSEMSAKAHSVHKRHSEKETINGLTEKIGGIGATVKEAQRKIEEYKTQLNDKSIEIEILKEEYLKLKGKSEGAVSPIAELSSENDMNTGRESTAVSVMQPSTSEQCPEIKEVLSIEYYSLTTTQFPRIPPVAHSSKVLSTASSQTVVPQDATTLIRLLQLKIETLDTFLSELSQNAALKLANNRPYGGLGIPQVLSNCEILEMICDELLTAPPPHVDIQSWRIGFATGVERAQEQIPSIEMNGNEGLTQKPVLRRTQTFRQPVAQEPPFEEVPDPKEKKLNRQKTSKFKRKHTSVEEFNWTRRSMSTLRSPRTFESGTKIVQEALARPLEALRKNGNLTSKFLNKLIFKVYQTAISKKKELETYEFIEISYEFFFKKYGLQEVADGKFTDFIGSLFTYSNPRVTNFLRLIGGAHKLGQTDYCKATLNHFLSVYDYMLTSKSGIPVQLDKNPPRLTLPAIRAVELLRERPFPKEVAFSLQNWVEDNKKSDPKKVNIHGVIDCDDFLLQVSEEFQRLQEKISEGLFIVFESLMSDKKTINSVEFQMALRVFNNKTLRGAPSQEYSFGEFSQECLSQNLLSLKAIQSIRSCPEICTTIAASKPMLLTIINSLEKEPESTWDSLPLSTLSKRLVYLEESLEHKSSAVVSLGWEIYSQELLRLEESLHFNNAED